ncbi:DUF2867 domain-containing protein [Streptomyces sp. NPDC005805]|uniref:DUF2867 domain-containing protein n=1 Tax=Streptomyces sp. NPDC005805 TaxID=3157068 RepID=UPI0034118D81
MRSVVGVRRVPELLRAGSALPAVHYADVFTLTTGADPATTPEEWARAMFGDVPGPGERFIWRGLLGLRLAPGRSSETVAGWRVAQREADRIRLEAGSWFLACELLVHRGEGRVSLGTFLHYRRRLGRTVWTPLSAVHRRLAPGLLGDAEARVLATA